MNGNVGRAIGNVAGRTGTLPGEPERCRANRNVGRAIGNVAGRAGTLPAEPERCRANRNVSGRPGTLAGPLERRKSNWLDSPPQLEAPALLFFQSACVEESLTGTLARHLADFLRRERYTPAAKAGI